MTPSPVRHRVKFKQRTPRSTRGSGRRTTRTLVAALLAVSLGAPLTILLRRAVRENLADDLAERARRSPAGILAGDEALLRLPPVTAHGAAPAPASGVVAIGWSTPAPDAPVVRSWEIPFAAGIRRTPLTTATAPIAPPPTLAAAPLTRGVNTAPPLPNVVRPAAATAPLASLVAAASTTTPATALGVERAPVSLLAPTTSAAVIPGPRPRLAAPVPATGPLPFIWSGAATPAPSQSVNANWTTAGNWVNNAAPGPTASENIVYAAAPVAATATAVDVNYTINSLTFQAGAPSYNVSSGAGSTLTVGAGGLTDASATAQTVNVPVVLGAAQTWNVSNAAGLLSLPGGLTGTGGLTKTGAGTLSFDGSTTSNFGPMAVTGGTLLLNKSESTLAVTGDLAVGNAVNPGAATSAVARLLQSDQTGAGTNLTVYRDGLFDLTRPNGGGILSAFTTVNNVTMTGGEVRIGAGTLRPIGSITTNAAPASARITSTDFDSDIGLGNANHTFNVARGTATYDLDVQAGISGGSLTKTGAGVLRLAGIFNSAFSVTLNTGTIAVADDNALGYNFGGGGDVVARRGGASPSAYDPTLNYTAFTLAGGTLTADGGDRVIGNPVNLTGNATIGASLDGTPRAFSFVNTLTVTNSQTLTVNNNAPTIFSGLVSLAPSGTLTVSGTGTTTISGQVVDNNQPQGAPSPGYLAKTGSGTLILSNNNTYRGGTTVSAGTLLATNSPEGFGDSATGRGTVLVQDGARLGGTGSVGGQNTPSLTGGGTGNAVSVAYGDVVIGGSPAIPSLVNAAGPANPAILGAGVNGAGVLTVNGNLTLTSTALLEEELGGTKAGAGGYDQVRVGGAIALGGNLSLATINGFTLTVGQTFYILDGVTPQSVVSGVFANATPETATTGLFTDTRGDLFRINYAATDPDDTSHTTGNDVSVTVLSIPEPGSLALAALGVAAGAGVFLRRRRRG